MKSGVSLRRVRFIPPVHTSRYSRLEKPDYYTRKDCHVYILNKKNAARGTYHYAYARQSQVSWKKKKRKEKTEKIRKNEKR